MPELATPESPQTNTMPILGEVASEVSTVDAGKGYVDEIAKSKDEVLEEHGRGDLRLYERLLGDEQVYATFTQRRNAVIARELRVDSGGDQPLDQQAADFLRENLTQCGFDRASWKMLTGIMYGKGIGECMLAIRDTPYGMKVVIDSIKVRRSRRFGFTVQGQLVLYRDSEKVPMPDRKFWVYTCGADDDDDVNGRGLGHWLYWPVWFKRNAYRFWLIFLELFSQPIPIGTHPASWQKAQQDDFLEKLDGIRAGGKLALPLGTDVKPFVTGSNASSDYEAFVRLVDATIAKIIVTQTMTTDNGSSLAQGKVHLKVATMGAKSDSDLLTESFQRGPAAWLTEWNFPGAKTPVIYRDFSEPEDVTASATRDKALYEMGYRPTPERVTETYGDGYEPFTPAPAQEPSVNGITAGHLASGFTAFAEGLRARFDRVHRTEFAEPRSASDDVEALLDGDGWRRIMGPELDRLDALLADASTLDEAKTRLGRLIDEDPNMMAAALAQVLFAARVGGNAEFNPDTDATNG